MKKEKIYDKVCDHGVKLIVIQNLLKSINMYLFVGGIKDTDVLKGKTLIWY